MIKLMIFIKKYDHVSRQEFIDHYENSHVPLVLKHTGKYMLDYRRSYPDWNDPVIVSRNYSFGDIPSQEPTFDVVTEIWVKDRETLTAMFKVASDPELASIIDADLGKVRDGKNNRMFITEERGMPGR